MVEFSLKSSIAPGADNPRNDHGTSAKRTENGATVVLMVESRPLTDLAEEEANKFARKIDRLLETYSPVELENQIFWRVLTRNLEVALEALKSRIPELRTGRVGSREAIPSFKPKEPF